MVKAQNIELSKGMGVVSGARIVIWS